MSEQILERIDDRRAQLQSLRDVDFCRQFPAYLRALDSDSGVRRILRAVREESEAALQRFVVIPDELIVELVEIRDSLISDAPEIAAASDPPEPTDVIQHRYWVMDTTTGFDLAAAHRVEIGFKPFTPVLQRTGQPRQCSDCDPDPPWTALRRRMGRQAWIWAAAGARSYDLVEYTVQIENVQAKYSSARSQFKLDERTLPGLADERLRLVAEQIVPEPFLREAGEDEATYMERAFRRVLHEIGDLGALRRALSGERLSDPDQGTFDRLVAFLRSELELLHNEVVDRVRVERSSFRHKAVDRFRGASKWTIGAVATVLITLIVTGIVGVATDWFG